MKFELYPHQTLALEMIKDSFRAGKRRPVVQATTGFGKTLLAAAIVSGALAKGKRVIFTVPSISLVDQTVGKFHDQGITCVGVMQGQHPLTDAEQPVQVASVQTLMRRKIPAVDIVIVDEAHLWFQFLGEWMRQPEWLTVPFIGLSATPWTRGLGKHYDDLLVATRFADLVRDGFLAPYRVFAPSHPDLSKVHTVAGDYHEGELSDVMSQPTLVADVVATWLRQGEDRPTLCFAVDRAHARKLADQFEEAGVACGYVDANTPREEREAIGRRMAEGQLRVVCNVGTLTTGVDWDIRCILLARPTKSEMLYVQIIGRGLRPAEGKADCIVLDHSDTTLRLGFPADIHHDRLDDGKHHASKAQPRDRKTPLPKECPACTHLKPAGIHKCPSCGFMPERQSPIEERQGELVSLTGKKQRKAEASPHDRQCFYSMLQWYRQKHDKSDGFVKAKFFSRFKEWPTGYSRDALPADTAFMNWLKADTIRFIKGCQKAEKEAEHHAP